MLASSSGLCSSTELRACAGICHRSYHLSCAQRHLILWNHCQVHLPCLSYLWSEHIFSANSIREWAGAHSCYASRDNHLASWPGQPSQTLIPCLGCMQVSMYRCFHTISSWPSCVGTRSAATKLDLSSGRRCGASFLLIKHTQCYVCYPCTTPLTMTDGGCNM